LILLVHSQTLAKSRRAGQSAKFLPFLRHNCMVQATYVLQVAF